MSRYAQLTPLLLASQEPRIVLSFDELDRVVAGGLPNSAKQYHAWWANNASSQSHAKFWLDAGRRAAPDFKGKKAVFTLDSSVDTSELAAAVVGESTPQDLTEYVESSLSLERDLEDQIVSHLDVLEPGLTLVSRQESSDIGRLDLLARVRQKTLRLARLLGTSAGTQRKKESRRRLFSLPAGSENRSVGRRKRFLV
jgi:hypothetical protein